MKKTLIYIIVAAVLVGLAAYKIAGNKEKQTQEVKEVAKQVDKINVNVEKILIQITVQTEHLSRSRK